MERCWGWLLSLISHLAKWLTSRGHFVTDRECKTEAPRPPGVQQLFQAADKETDKAVILSGPKHYQATREHFRSLQACNWLNDNIVNLYVQLLQAKNIAATEAGLQMPKAFVFNTFFWTRLACFGTAFDYSGVASWTKRLDVFSHDLLLFPINHNNLHWCLASADLRNDTISYYDSVHGSGLSGHSEDVVLSTLERWLQEEAHCKGQHAHICWKKVTVRDDLPKQHDGGSCGVFICQYAKQLLQGAKVQSAFSQQNIPELRLQMAIELLDAFWQPEPQS